MAFKNDARTSGAPASDLSQQPLALALGILSIRAKAGAPDATIQDRLLSLRFLFSRHGAALNRQPIGDYEQKAVEVAGDQFCELVDGVSGRMPEAWQRQAAYVWAGMARQLSIPRQKDRAVSTGVDAAKAPSSLLWHKLAFAAQAYSAAEHCPPLSRLAARVFHRTTADLLRLGVDHGSLQALHTEFRGIAARRGDLVRLPGIKKLVYNKAVIPNSIG